MRIAQIAPIWHAVPPKESSGVEILVSLLTEELVRRGHEVHLFASGDSKTNAILEPATKKSLYAIGIQPFTNDNYPFFNISNVYSRANEFDIIHNHAGHLALLFTKLNKIKIPSLHTIHLAKFHDYEKELFYKKYNEETFVFLSQKAGKKFPFLKNKEIIYNGIDITKFEFSNSDGNYLLFLGRIAPEKGTDIAIEIAKRAKEKIIIAGGLDNSNRDYYKKSIEPLIDQNNVKYVGEVGAFSKEKSDLLRNAKAILVPINWDEPFGLVMPEAMACGTPVIAFRRGSVPEIVKDGETGFIIEPGDIEGMVKAVKKVDQIDRKKCRQWVEKNFTVEKMVDGYEKVYQRLIHPVK